MPLILATSIHAASIRLRDGSERAVEPAAFASLAIASIEELRLADPPPPNRWRLGFLLQTAAGDSLRTERLRLRDDRLLVETPLTGLTELPLSAASVLWFSPPGTISETTRREIQQIAASHLRQDALFVRKAGEWVRLDGVLQSLDEKRIVFRWQENEREVPLALAGALVLAASQPPATPRERLAAVWGRDGSRLVGEVCTLTTDSVTLATPSLGSATVPLDSLAVVDALWGRSVFVSELEPAAVTEAGWFGTRFPWRRDASVSGQPLTLRGRTFERGLGVHSRSLLAYQLSKNFSLLTGVIGLDDVGGKLGRVQFVVRGDGRELFRATAGGADEPKPLRVAVAGVERLELLVDFARDEDTGDRADWADLRLVR
ncbi:MAG: NPCBM/NEW2 domain-containing protein [Verrucomicrobia bacterium]|nr:NPCBM/NEW2 domain-containing protein [Verrucomicrobiota bacterium]